MTADEIDDENYEKIIKVSEDLLTGGISLKDAKGAVKSAIMENITTAGKAWKLLSKKSGSLPFGGDAKKSASMTTNYQNLMQMAKGYATEGGKYYKDPEMLADMRYALEYLHENVYTDRSSRKLTSNNWWDWQIGSAQPLVRTVMFLRDELTEDEIKKYLSPVDEYVPYPDGTMANRADTAYVAMLSAALQKDYKRLARSREMMNECFTYVTSGDGFYKDGSFIQHNNIPYTGSYGPIMLDTLSWMIYAVDDTCFAFSDEVKEFQYWSAVESFVPATFRGAFHGHVRGRSITRSSTDVQLGTSVVNGMLLLAEYLDEEKDAEKIGVIKSIIKEYDGYNGAQYKQSFHPYLLQLYLDIVNDKSVTAREDSSHATLFAGMDRAVAETKNYGVGISMSSSRVAKYESFAKENTKGWYTGDGMVYIYTTVNDFSPNYWKTVDMYKLPGTTVTTAERRSPDKIDSSLTDRDFVGGVSLEKSLVAAMDLTSQAVGYRSSLEARKGWFVFDNEVVCLGAGINCRDKYGVLTVIENRMFKSKNVFSSSGNTVTEKKGTLTEAETLYIENYGGIYLPTRENVEYEKTGSFLELWIDHGEKPQNETYAYVLLPTMSKDEVSAYSSAADIEIIANTEKYMAVREKTTGITGYIFWEAGEVGGVKVSSPCTVMVSADKIAVSDPTWKLGEINVTVDGKEYKAENLSCGMTAVIER